MFLLAQISDLLYLFFRGRHHKNSTSAYLSKQSGPKSFGRRGTCHL